MRPLSKGHGQADPVFCLEDVELRYRDTRDKRGQAAVRCGWCKARTKRVVYAAAREWFLAHECVHPFAALVSRPLEPFNDNSAAFRLLEAQAAGQWELMMNLTLPENVFRGGRRIGFEPTAEAIEHAARIDERLTALLGGVPRPKRTPPGGRYATVLPFPTPEQRKATLAA